MTRVCNVCGLEKATERDFYRRTSRGREGFGHTCKVCAKARSRSKSAAARQERFKGPLVTRRIGYRGIVALAATCPECRRFLDAREFPKISGSRRNLRRCKACTSAARSPDQRAKAVERSRAHRARAGRTDYGTRKARKYGVPADRFSRTELLESYAARGLSACVYCGGTYQHDDHDVPLSRGGSHSLANLVPACAACNMRKHTLTGEEFRRRYLL